MRLWVFSILIAVSVSQSAHATRVRIAQNQQKLCTIMAPSADGKEATLESEPGITVGDLKKLAKSGGDADERAENAQWAKWYTGVSDLSKLSEDKKKIANWMDCDNIRALREALFRELYSDPRLDCHGGKFLYRFRLVKGAFKMDLYQRDADGEAMKPVLTGSDVSFTDTTSKTCPTRIVQTTPDEKNFKLCLQVNPDQKTQTVGSVGLKLKDTTLDDNDRKVQCRLDDRFARVAKTAIKTELPAPAPGSSPANLSSSKTVASRVAR